MAARKTRKHLDLTCMTVTSPEVKRMIELGVPAGSFCTVLPEEFPEFEKAACEWVKRGLNNADIVLGRDRDASWASGNGGQGGSNCGMIDLVVGRLSAIPDCPKSTIVTGPNFCADAARLYITQRGDIDKYFHLHKGNSTIKSTKNKSAVAMKADHCRMIGRESVKIYAGKGNWEGLGRVGERNSQGGEILGRGKIELIAGDYNDIQPAVKGDNMAKALKKIYAMIKGIYGAIHAHHILNMRLCAHLLGHSHPVVALGAGIAFPDPSLFTASLELFIKHMMGSVNMILKQLDCIINEFASTGMGNPGGTSLPGWESIKSQTVFVT